MAWGQLQGHQAQLALELGSARCSTSVWVRALLFHLRLGGSVLLPSHSFPKLVIFLCSVALGLGRGNLSLPWESRDAGDGGDTEHSSCLLLVPRAASL